MIKNLEKGGTGLRVYQPSGFRRRIRGKKEKVAVAQGRGETEE